MRIASRNRRVGVNAKTRLRGTCSRSIFRDQDAFSASGLPCLALSVSDCLSVSDYFFLAAFLTAVFTGAVLAVVLAGIDLAGIDFTAASFFAGLGATALGDVFLTSVGFFVAGATDLVALFLTAVSVATGVSLATFLEALPPKIPSQPSEYFSFVPTRVIVTESPFNQN